MTPVLVYEPAPWTADAACRRMDPNIFFPHRGESTIPAQTVCETCSVIGDCLRYAVRHRIKQGVWGGQSEQQRRRLYRRVPATTRRREPFHGTAPRYRQGCRCMSCRVARVTEDWGRKEQGEERRRTDGPPALILHSEGSADGVVAP